MTSRTLKAPIGLLTVTERDGALVAIDWGIEAEHQDRRSPLLDETERQIAAYFDGKLKRFDLPVAPAGSAFQRRVWDMIAEIPFGERASYGGIARGLETAPRAVGVACGRNQLALVVPCHRVVGAGGLIGGWSGFGGLDTKKWLLAHEGQPVA
ncbi:methylated-DNA--[protein]-cysteine S-methyltransferase [Inquilinus sp. CAU 1745]|uniref:methylated-DNA--[protein]-cysteine S-methyltransferase n=1 Tax=Inquilinus sp. CAU 1745 TaxID=3140369 RepID=UPI00325BEEDA